MAKDKRYEQPSCFLVGYEVPDTAWGRWVFVDGKDNRPDDKCCTMTECEAIAAREKMPSHGAMVYELVPVQL